MLTAEVVVGFERGSVFVRESRRNVEICAVVYEPYVGVIRESFSVAVSTEDGRAGETCSLRI